MAIHLNVGYRLYKTVDSISDLQTPLGDCFVNCLEDGFLYNSENGVVQKITNIMFFSRLDTFTGMGNMPYAIAASTSSGNDAIITLPANEEKNYVIDLLAYSYNAVNPNSVGKLTVKRAAEIILDIDIPDGGCGYIYTPMEFAADGYNIPLEVKLHGVGTGSYARIGKLSIKYRE